MSILPICTGGSQCAFEVSIPLIQKRKVKKSVRFNSVIKLFPADEIQHDEGQGNDSDGGFKGKSVIASELSIPPNVKKTWGKAYQYCMEAREIPPELKTEVIASINQWISRRGLEKIFVKSIRNDLRERRELQHRVVLSVQRRCKRQKLDEKMSRKLIRVASKTLSCTSRAWALLLAEADAEFVRLSRREERFQEEPTPRSVFSSLRDWFEEEIEAVSMLQKGQSTRSLMSLPLCSIDLEEDKKTIKPKQSILKREDSTRSLRSLQAYLPSLIQRPKKKKPRMKRGTSLRNLTSVPITLPDAGDMVQQALRQTPKPRPKAGIVHPPSLSDPPDTVDTKASV